MLERKWDIQLTVKPLLRLYSLAQITVCLYNITINDIYFSKVLRFLLRLKKRSKLFNISNKTSIQGFHRVRTVYLYYWNKSANEYKLYFNLNLGLNRTIFHSLSIKNVFLNFSLKHQHSTRVRISRQIWCERWLILRNFVTI